MPQFPRRSPSPVVTGGYRAFRPFVREDFLCQCAYCLCSEILAGGEENFELDHFRPQRLFRDLVDDFYNIYYACHPCNQIKRGEWPPKELEEKGITFVDLCTDEFETHFRPEQDGVWKGITPPAAYTVDKLRLNRKHLVLVRRLLERLGLAVNELSISEVHLGSDYRFGSQQID